LLLEQEHLLEIPPYVFNEPDPTYPVRGDNSVYYKKNLYTLPKGTYKGRGSYVTIKIRDGELIINDQHERHIATHKYCSLEGRVISNTDHKRDKSKKLDSLMLEVAVLFPDNDKALMYLEKIRREKPRYARDQFQYIRKCVEEKANVDIAGWTLDYCMDHGIYSAKDFEAVMDKYLRDRLDSGQKIPEAKKVALSINKKVAEITPSTSNILDYEKIMKN